MTRKRKGWERRASTTKKPPSIKVMPAQQTAMCSKSTETHQGKESKKTKIFNLSVLNWVLLVVLFAWLYAYLGCEPYIKDYVVSPLNPDEAVNAVGLFRAGLNFVMVTIVILFTYWDRWGSFRHAMANNIEDAELKKRANALFIPFALAIIPFTTAASDLGTLLSVPNLTYYLLMAFLLLPIVLDGLVAAVFVRKYPGKPFKRILASHILAFSFMIIAAFVMAVLLSFPGRI